MMSGFELNIKNVREAGGWFAEAAQTVRHRGGHGLESGKSFNFPELSLQHSNAVATQWWAFFASNSRNVVTCILSLSCNTD